MAVNTCVFLTPLGKMRASEENGFVTGLWFENQKYFPKMDDWNEKNSAILLDLGIWVERYFDGKIDKITPPLLFCGTDFQIKVWNILRQIPYGKTITYGEIAKMISCETQNGKMSAQAIGNAVGQNTISILAPCHRVVGFDGSLRGYAAGLDKKSFLLQLEGVKLNKK